MIIREAILRGAGVEFVLTNRESVGDRVESWLTDIAGWYGGVGVVDGGSQRRLGHGFFPSPSLRTGRELTLSGTLVFQSEADRSIADRFVSGLLWDGELGELQVTTDDLTLVSQVKLGGEIRHAYLGTSAMEVQVPLTAPDPFLYAPARRYQVFPAGAGEGLEYNLFASQGAPVGENLAALSGAAKSYGTVQTVDGVEYLTVDRRVNTSLPGSFALTTVPVVPGKSYKVRTAVSADSEGSEYAMRTNIVGGPHASFKYFVADGADITVPAPVGQEDTRTWVVTAPPGATRMDIFFFPLHPHGQTQAAAQTVSVQVWECSPTLGWGAGAPFSGAFANGGNADAHPIYTVHGSWPAGFRITTGSSVIEYPSPVHPSTPVSIDNRTGEVMVGGVDQTYRLTRRDWVRVPAGSAIQPRITALAPSTGWMDVDIQDTYM